jgi:hypothetical protein
MGRDFTGLDADRLRAEHTRSKRRAVPLPVGLSIFTVRPIHIRL